MNYPTYPVLRCLLSVMHVAACGRQTFDKDMPQPIFHVTSVEKGNKLVLMSETLLGLPVKHSEKAIRLLGGAHGGNTVNTTLSEIFSDDKSILEKFSLPFWGDVCILVCRLYMLYISYNIYIKQVLHVCY